MIRNKTRELATQETRRFLDKIQEVGFWGLPSSHEPDIGLDGAQWIIEGVKDGKYHIADRWSPSKGSVYDLGMLAIQLSELNIPKREIY